MKTIGYCALFRKTDVLQQCLLKLWSKISCSTSYFL